MIEREIVVTVPGHPKPKGSLICCRDRKHTLREDNKGTKPWRTEVARIAKKIKQRADKGQAIGVEATSTLERPDYHYGTGRNAATIKDRYRDTRPVGRGTGDVDKLVRLLLDALQDVGVLVDDAQVTECTTRKAYAEARTADALQHPGVRIRIYPIEGAI